ncbi:TetR/AcrR family transcriptional regulator [Paenibacillus gansuensis]|uniref:TetR/AcrR family transcriptional regulator n=1 Tax=Paenibacillus gansuensis TaxID=306542 RepID=A0ABW5PMQ2_9BACL
MSKERVTDKQQKILESAIDIFAEKGYAAASTSEIAKRAGVAEGTIFRHYRTKHELLTAIIGPLLMKMVSPFVIKDFKKEVFDKDYGSYEEFLRRLMENRMKFARSHAALLKILAQEIAFQPEIQSEFKKLFKEHIYPLFLKVVEHFKEKGELKDLPSETIIRLTITTIVSTVLARFLILTEGTAEEEQRFLEDTVRFIMGGVGRV